MKAVLFNILHRIYPVKQGLEQFKLNVNYSCDFRGFIFPLYVLQFLLNDMQKCMDKSGWKAL